MATAIVELPHSDAGNPEESVHFEQRVIRIDADSKSHQITDQDTCTRAWELLNANKCLQQEIIDHHKPIKQAQYDAWKVTCGQENKLLAPLKADEALLKGAIAAWDAEQKRIREEAERAALEAAEREQAEMIEAVIEQAEASGASVEEVAAIVNMPAVAPMPVLPPAPRVMPKGSGSVTYALVAKLTNKHALVQHIASKPELQNLLDVNEGNLNKYIRATDGRIALPGVTIMKTPTVRATKGKR